MKNQGKSLPALGRRALLGMTMAAGLMATAFTPMSAIAQDNFFAGKTITIYVGFGPGGGYDLYARLVAEHMGRFIPGHPNIIVENMPGGGGRTAAQYLYSVAPQDGTALSVIVQSIVLDSLLGVLPGDLDASRFNAIGRMTPEYELGMIANTAEAKTLEDIKSIPVTFASTGAGSASMFVPNMLNDMEGTQFRVIAGYQGAAAAMLALEGGEVDGAMQGLAGMTASKPNWIPDGIVNVVWLLGPEPIDALPGVPAVGQLGQNDLDRAALRVVSEAAEIGRSLIAPPNVPEERIEVLREAFWTMVNDPDFLAEAELRGHFIEPLSGADLQAVMVEHMDVPQEVIDYVTPYVVVQ